jgi:uncharacterized membrane protein SpoIIM required for sporulation
VDLDAYVAEHSGEWRRLEQLSRRRRLAASEVDELVALYQRAATHLSVVRSRSPDPTLVARLSRLVLSARSAITGGSTVSWRSIGRFFASTFPLAVYRGWAWWSAVAVGFSAVPFGIMGYAASRPEFARAFLSDAEIDQVVDSAFVSYYSEHPAHDFALLVWTNNAFLSAQCLAAGVLILPVLYLLWENALNIGLMGGVMIGHGRGDVFFTYITPHGLLELTAVYVAAGFGLRIGWAWIAPGRYRTRGQAMATTAREAMVVAMGLVAVLLVSGLVEAFVTPSVLPAPARLGIGVLVWLGFFGYVIGLGRRAERAGVSTDLVEFERGATVPTS